MKGLELARRFYEETVRRGLADRAGSEHVG